MIHVQGGCQQDYHRIKFIQNKWHHNPFLSTLAKQYPDYRDNGSMDKVLALLAREMESGFLEPT